MKNSEKNFFAGLSVIWILTALLSLAWVGVLIWAVIYIVTHIGGWIN